MTRADEISATVDFLRNIGLELIEADDANGFLDTIKIAAGKLYYQPGKTSPANILHEARSEERRVGKECVGTCRSRWPLYNKRKKQCNKRVQQQRKIIIE